MYVDVYVDVDMSAGV